MRHQEGSESSYEHVCNPSQKPGNPTCQEGLQRLQQGGAGAAGARGLGGPELGRQQQPRRAAGAAEDAAAQPAVVPPPGERPAQRFRGFNTSAFISQPGSCCTASSTLPLLAPCLARTSWLLDCKLTHGDALPVLLEHKQAAHDHPREPDSAASVCTCWQLPQQQD
jgi:hypothetical protein